MKHIWTGSRSGFRYWDPPKIFDDTEDNPEKNSSPHVMKDAKHPAFPLEELSKNTKDDETPPV